jgi:hypothetical protein
MDLVNAGHLQNDSEARAIRGAIIQKRESLRCIEREISQLVETKKGVEQDLVRLGIALAPHTGNHSLFPIEILSRIFVLLALDCGTVNFPLGRNIGVPPQLVVSHVCSHWRRVALRTHELWSDTQIFYTRHTTNDTIRLLQRWLFRARTFPVALRLSTNLDRSFNGDGLAIAFKLQNILLPIQVKKLSLSLTYNIFMALSTLPEAMLSGLSEIELDLMFPDSQENIDMSTPHPLISTRLQSLSFEGVGFKTPAWFGPPHPSLSWSQLRSLTIGIYLGGNLHLVMGTLRQIPKLEALDLCILGHDADLDQLTMPSLRTFSLHVKVDTGMEIDKILRYFMCPTLAEFDFLLDLHGDWTCETFGILKQHYNMQELREATFVGNFSLPVSSFLRDAPMLRSLSLGRNAIMDDDAVIGISNGTLGQFLRELDINFACDVGEVLGMVEARKKMADSLITNGCTWKEEITILKDIVIHTNENGYEDRVIAFEEAGINVTFM